ncbi:uncharacterized protein LOC127148918 [Cucumis melo]|uniref:Uncharacterized protein LOC127148918 n=1 Tax=Cucumis melo TaxID=3656 RepID=A0ABM3KNG0_CUCME|nr:uncharacterized protein LOC127148918 [Cucumis melo]
MDNPTKAQMWLTSLETIFRYMKCPNDQKFKESICAKFFFANVRYAKQQKFLNLEQGDMTMEQYDAEFDMLSHFAPDVVKNEATRTEKPTTHADALRLALDLSLHEKAISSKAVGRGTTPGQKRMAELQPTVAPQRNLRPGGLFQRHRQKLATAGKTMRELPAYQSCGRYHGGRCLARNGVCFRCKQPGHIVDFCPQKLLETTSN